MSLKRAMKMAMESIDFQDGRFFGALTEAVAAYRASVYVSGNTIHIDPTQMQTVIKKYANVIVVFDIDVVSLNASAGVPMLNPNNAMEFYSYLEDDEGHTPRMFESLVALNKSKATLTFGVDLAKSKMLGEFTKWPFNITISLRLLHYLSDDEIAAILLHEIGHLFSYVEYSAFTYTLNAVLASVLNDFFSTNDPKQRAVVLQYFEDVTKTKIENKEGLANDTNVGRAVVTTIIVKDFFDSLRSVDNTAVYDRKTFEQMADNFAARHGAARALATANMKLDRVYGIGESSTWFAAFFEKTASLWLSLMMGVGFGSGVGVVFFAFFLLTTNKPHALRSIYDSPIERAKNLRRQVIESLKNPSIGAELRKKALEDIQKIDEVVASYREFETITTTIISFFSSRSRNATDQVRFQKELEEMSSNRLFASAAKLSLTKD